MQIIISSSTGNQASSVPGVIDGLGNKVDAEIEVDDFVLLFPTEEEVVAAEVEADVPPGILPEEAVTEALTVELAPISLNKTKDIKENFRNRRVNSSICTYLLSNLLLHY